MFMSYLVVMAGGALGSAARMWMSLFCAVRFGETFPVGTLAVNALGCLVIGAFSPLIRQFVMIGVLGGFTTFSSFGLQTISLMGDGEWLYAALNVVLSVAVCLAFVWLGIILVSLLTHK
jgi:CrcB protein